MISTSFRIQWMWWIYFVALAFKTVSEKSAILSQICMPLQLSVFRNVARQFRTLIALSSLQKSIIQVKQIADVSICRKFHGLSFTVTAEVVPDIQSRKNV